EAALAVLVVDALENHRGPPLLVLAHLPDEAVVGADQVALGAVDALVPQELGQLALPGRGHVLVPGGAGPDQRPADGGRFVAEQRLRPHVRLLGLTLGNRHLVPLYTVVPPPEGLQV